MKAIKFSAKAVRAQPKYRRELRSEGMQIFADIDSEGKQESIRQ